MLAAALPSLHSLQRQLPIEASERPGVAPRRRRCRRRSAALTVTAARRLVQRSTTPPRPHVPAKKPVLRVQSEWEGQELLRVMTVSDLHVDYEDNMKWVQSLDTACHSRDVLVLCGDVSDELGALEAALSCLASKFLHVFYCPGNHELWVREPDRQAGITDSATKLQLILDMCRRLGVHTRPRRIGDLWIVPLLSWHHRTWDREPDIPNVPPPSPWTIADYGACIWPPSVPGGDEPGSEALAAWFDSLNDGPEWEQLLASRASCDIVSFSHFLPHQALLPEKRYLYFPNLSKAVGSAPLAARLARLRPDIHLFGHTHFAWDACIGGTRYIQAPLCSPVERQKRLFTVSFGACLDEAEADPVGALWLPQQVYVGLAPSKEERQAVAASASASQGSANAGDGRQAVAAVAAAARQQGGPASNGSGLQQQAAQQEAVRQQAGYMLQLIEPQQDLQQQQQQQQQQQLADAPQQEACTSCTPARPRSELQIEMELAWGWQPLRHGAAVPSLLAHWSMYYEMNQRQPDNVELAPWVERIWRRRRQRARAGAASHSTDAGTGLMSSGGETALSSLSESEGSSGEGGEAAAGMDSSLSEE